MLNKELMQGYTLIVVLDKAKENVLLCRRVKEPYAGLYNFVGGKIEDAESSLEAAYRELAEETGITEEEIHLSPVMTLSYLSSKRSMDVYAGVLRKNKILQKELNPLEWFSLDTEFYNEEIFAGEGNVGHILSHLQKHKEFLAEQEGECIGIDGCKEGWLVAEVLDRKLNLRRCHDMREIAELYPEASQMCIDMVMGLPEGMGDIRPDSFARRILQGKSMAIFSVPCRQAVYADSEERMIAQNEEFLEKSLGRQTVAIIPKIRELDEFLQSGGEFIHRIKESHPELVFSRLAGHTVMTNKAKQNGMLERIEILKEYIDELELGKLKEMAQEYKCGVSEILDAACLAITARMAAEDKVQIIPEFPMRDKKGIPMRMVIPKVKSDESF